MEFKSLTAEELETAKRKLRANAERGEPLRMDKQTTLLTDAHAEETTALIDAIKSVPCHY